MATDTLLFLTDTHIGTGTAGFQMQPRRPDLLRPAFAALKQLTSDQQVRLVVHGGDLTELGTPEQIGQGVTLLRDLAVPTAMCFGNHDLTTPESVGNWRAAMASAGLPLADTVAPCGDWDVILLNTHWAWESSPRLLWTFQQRGVETHTETQLAWLDAELRRQPDRPAIVVTHVPPDAIPPRLSGKETPIHAADAAYSSGLESVLDRHRRVKLVLAGHCHVNCATQQPGRVHLSTSATLEPPFEVRLIRLSPRSLKVETVGLLPMTPDIQWLPEQAWISGQTCDRTIQLAW